MILSTITMAKDQQPAHQMATYTSLMLLQIRSSNASKRIFAHFILKKENNHFKRCITDTMQPFGALTGRTHAMAHCLPPAHTTRRWRFGRMQEITPGDSCISSANMLEVSMLLPGHRGSVVQFQQPALQTARSHSQHAAMTTLGLSPLYLMLIKWASTLSLFSLSHSTLTQL